MDPVTQSTQAQPTRDRDRRMLAATELFNAQRAAIVEVLELRQRLSAFCLQHTQDESDRISAETSRRWIKKRKMWSDFLAEFDIRDFRVFFRMEEQCFYELRDKIVAAVGEKAFKSEHYIKTVLSDTTTPEGRMYKAHCATSSGYVCGEVKMAIGIKILAGSPILDLSYVFQLNRRHVLEIFHQVVEEWFCNDKVVSMNVDDYLDDDDAMKKTAHKFGERTDGIMSGCIGAVDGWMVKIKEPSESDGVENPGHYFSRKGYFALNVQVMVDKDKRVLWRSIGNIGSTHDSTAFQNSKLYERLMKDSDTLVRKGFYIIGDSAYALRSFLLLPYDNARPGTPEDAFNFYLSSNRIYVECAFGEIDRRWGILWKSLEFSLKHTSKIIDACLRLHNFLVEYRLRNARQQRVVQRQNTYDYRHFDEERLGYLRSHPENAVAGIHGQVGPRPRGRPSDVENWNRLKGVAIRNAIRDDLASASFARPRRSTWKVAQFGRVQLVDDDT